MSAKRFIVAFLVLSYLLQVFRFTVPFLSYYTNYHYFSKVVCINKDNPGMHCNGYCQVRKMVKKEQKHSENDHQTTFDHALRLDFFVQQVKTSFASLLMSNVFPHRMNERAYALCQLTPPTPPPQIG